LNTEAVTVLEQLISDYVQYAYYNKTTVVRSCAPPISLRR